MRKSRLIIKGLIFLTLLNQISTAQEFGKIPFRKCWQTERENASIVFTASDNEAKIYSAFSDGSLESIDKRSGEIIWHSDIGGEILRTFYLDKEKLYLLSKKTRLNELEELNLKSVSLNTGITIWQKTLSIKNADDLHLIGDAYKLYLLSAAGEFFVIDEHVGDIDLNENLAVEPSTLPYFLRNNLIFGTRDKRIVSVSTKTGNLESRFQLEDIPVYILGSDENDKLYIGDISGKITAINASDTKVRWQVKTGAGIASLAETKEGLIVTSFDNYVYLFSEKNGNRQWRKRLSGRSIGKPFIKNRIGVFSTLNGNDTVFIELDKGKAVNKILIPEENYFLGNPIGLGDLLLFQTYKGLTAFGTEGECQTK